MENLLVPYQATTHIACTKALVLAPHPDDEVFGCGGAIMQHVAQNIPVHVIVVTDGAFGDLSTDYKHTRQNESIAAATILGYGKPEFWPYKDRALSYGEKLVQDILEAIQSISADLVYAPSILEMHPDHRALGMAAMEAVRRSGKSVQLACYEIGIPLHPNCILDISHLTERKLSAMQCFTSQIQKQRYDLDIQALNRYRTYTLPHHVTAAEAYLLLTAEELIHDPFKIYQSEYIRQKALGLNLNQANEPLVSIIICSMDQPKLANTLDSIALQTYPNIEVLVVNTCKSIHTESGGWCGRFPLRVIQVDTKFTHSQAANIGLASANGEYLTIINDNDVLYAEHISELVDRLQNHHYRCAYSGIIIEYYKNGKLENSTIANAPYDQTHLLNKHYIPISAMLFNQSLLKNGCQFDEQFALFADWDFCIQITQHTSLLHLDKISAVHRIDSTPALSPTQDNSLIDKCRHQFFEKWKQVLNSVQQNDLNQNIDKTAIDSHDQLRDIDHQLTAYREKITDLNNQLIQSNNRLESLQAHQKTLIQEAVTRETSLQETINNLKHSTSWQVTAPMRFASKMIQNRRQVLTKLRHKIMPVLKFIYWKLPTKLRNTLLTAAYQFAGPLFTGMGHYEMWCANQKFSLQRLPAYPTGNLAEMVNITDNPPAKTVPPGRIAIHAHIFYPDLAAEFVSYLRNMPFAYDLLVSTPNDKARKICEQAFSNLPLMEKLTIAIVPNRGRDIAPLFCVFNDVIHKYEYIAHIHSKKSLYNNGATDGWREYLLTSLLGSTSQIGSIFTLLSEENNGGIVYPQNFSGLPYSANTWLSNQNNGRIWCNRLGINFPTGYFDFPAGSMFWAKTEALRPLFEAAITIEDFPEETGQNDATLAHCLERLFVLITRKNGFKAFVLKDTLSKSWSRWRLDQYILRKQEDAHAILKHSSIKIIVFDIFDTLLTRPLLIPERVKAIVAQHVDEQTGQIYLETRATAEVQARQKTGKDIGLDAIFKEMTDLTDLKPEAISQLYQLEKSIEIAAVAPREEAIELLKFAATLNKRVLLASDMYLPRSTIEEMLLNNGINEWQDIYLSSETGLRKDTGDLYHHILTQENASPNEILMIGDNEHSDIQVPRDMNIEAHHILRPVECAKATPRLDYLMEKYLYSKDLNIQLALGQIIQENFKPLYYPNFDPSDFVPASPWAIGYSIAGPLILSFIQWLEKKATEEGIQQLYFLSREGKILKTVYDQWVTGKANSIASEYLVLSRRAITVPMITCFDDILEIARAQFSPNTLTNFIKERYGLNLSQQDYDELAQKQIWPKSKLVSVNNNDASHLVTLLKTLETRILSQAKEEHAALSVYLQKIKATSSSTAIVDVGYAATIQGCLNKLLNKRIHGYYLATEKRALKVSSLWDVTAEGCFAHDVIPQENPPLIFSTSFSLEKLLSSNDAQIVRYHLNESEQVTPEFRNLTKKELQANVTRTEIQRGIMDFVNHSITIRDKLLPDFIVPTGLAKDLYETFIEHPSKTELGILDKIILDDYYCGRGLIN